MRVQWAVAALTMICAWGATFPSHAQHQKTVKECQHEWRANKDSNHAKGITERSYVEQCRSGKPAAATKVNEPAATASNQAKAEANGAAAPDEYPTEAQAKSHCAGNTVVWVNLRSKIYHFAGARDYGHTKSGAYMCEAAADRAGMRAAKNEKHS